MSYCRWSSDDFQCDIYCFHHVDGWFQIYIAGKRRIFKEPLPPTVPFDDIEAWVKRQNKVTKMCEEADLVDIELPEAGASFQEPTAMAAARQLERLRDLGYRVPQEAIDDLRSEVDE